MFCSKCGNQNGEGINFCRQCGVDLESAAMMSLKKNDFENLTKIKSKDPDELSGKGVGNVIIGDGFFMVSVILSATHSSISSLLWLFLLIPAFYFFGKGFADVFQARQIRRRKKNEELNSVPKIAELPPPSISFVETIRKHTSGELVPAPSVTERTTRNLE